jgi:hypothetical protein
MSGKVLQQRSKLTSLSMAGLAVINAASVYTRSAEAQSAVET